MRPRSPEASTFWCSREKPRGEEKEAIAAWEDMSIEEHMAFYEKTGMDSKAAMKQVAKDRGVGKREIYDYLHKG